MSDVGGIINFLLSAVVFRTQQKKEGLKNWVPSSYLLDSNSLFAERVLVSWQNVDGTGQSF